MRDPVALARQLLGQGARRLISPKQVAHRVTGRAGFDQPRQHPLNVGLRIFDSFASTAPRANAPRFRTPGQTVGFYLRQPFRMVGRDMLVSRAKRLTAPRPCSSAFWATKTRACASFNVPNTRSQCRSTAGSFAFVAIAV